METENKGQGKEKERNIDRKTRPRGGEPGFSSGRLGLPGVLCAGLPCPSVLQKSGFCPVCRAAKQRKGLRAVGLRWLLP